jgi:hypothetical protein
MSRFWFYLGIFLVCSGIGTAFGVVLLVTFFWSDIKDELKKQHTSEQKDFNINSMSDDLRDELR